MLTKDEFLTIAEKALAGFQEAREDARYFEDCAIKSIKARYVGPSIERFAEITAAQHRRGQRLSIAKKKLAETIIDAAWKVK